MRRPAWQLVAGCRPAPRSLDRLVRGLVCVLRRQIVFLPAARAQRPLFRGRRILHSIHNRCLVVIAFLNQFADALVLHILIARQPLQVARLPRGFSAGFRGWFLHQLRRFDWR